MSIAQPRLGVTDEKGDKGSSLDQVEIVERGTAYIRFVLRISHRSVSMAPKVEDFGKCWPTDTGRTPLGRLCVVYKNASGQSEFVYRWPSRVV